MMAAQLSFGERLHVARDAGQFGGEARVKVVGSHIRSPNGRAP